MFEYKARIKRIVDGDTLDLQVDLGFNIMINIRGRLVGVNTPERGHEDFYKASAACRDLLRSVARFENPGELDAELLMRATFNFVPIVVSIVDRESLRPIRNLHFQWLRKVVLRASGLVHICHAILRSHPEKELGLTTVCGDKSSRIDYVLDVE